MGQMLEVNKAGTIASEIKADIRALSAPNTANIRTIRRQCSHKLEQAEPALILNLARELIKKYGRRWVAYELIRYHKATFQNIGRAELEEFGRGINSWDTVDAFARILAGPAWLKGQIPDDLIYQWAHSEDLWQRRAALVSTVALNVRSQGGAGDVSRTLAVCRVLVADHEDMVAKAMSWALRELVIHDPETVADFLAEHEVDLPARVKREVRNKLDTGLKNPRLKTD